ncbi:DNA gyrase subunit A [Iodidimonas nitroreducens]|uniref:DNA gyrase subunit A n=1 Tax=Iodidimonas nitroreducens TaxID=1236968 RepID=A0A5A7N3L6_9PROT|nr:DNA gyrase subunit A [Iodidimonas nitroreducens]GAK34039.1 DNA gyrase subunit A [alpha proteobacterium Q-1]GER02863.1 DNA gyrase subunit A [Iodidimonas nitroreducens]
MADTSDTSSPSRPISSIAIEEEMKASYLDYAMSVIVSRALPDVRDGLKPVHRRILYSMHENGYEWNKPYRKSARIVGDVMGKYHPHGDSAIYDALVRMAQDFSMRLPLVDGQGNFGSMDGDPAAAMRYTEARMAKVATALLTDIDKDTVNFADNYDGSESEPVVLPARFPNLLVNGAAGIAVGMATNIPPHNLGEVIDATLALIDGEASTNAELMAYVKGPDFPTGGIILGRAGIRSAIETGRGSIIIRSLSHFEEVRGREAIIITETPFQVNKSSMIEKIAEAVKTKRIEGIADLRDESDRDGVRVVIELKRDAVGDVVLNQLYRFTPVQTYFGINMLALNHGRPEQLSLRDVLKAFVAFREEVIVRRTKFELGKARDRAHLAVGLVVAVTNIDEVVAIIRSAPSPAVARETLLQRDWDAADILPYLDLIGEPPMPGSEGSVYRLTEVQVKAILDLRLHRLTALGRDEIGKELDELAEKIRGFLEILRSRVRLYEVLRSELVSVREEFATPRRTEISMLEASGVDEEDLIANEEMVVTVTHGGYIKRVPLDSYREQRRGGKGRSAMATREEDVLTTVFVANTHQPMLFFSNYGQVYKLKVWRLPLGTPQSRGKALINLLPLTDGEIITNLMALPEDEESWSELNVIFATRSGNVRRNLLSDFTNVPSNGKIAIRFEEGADDRLIGVRVAREEDDVLLAAHSGKCIRFPVRDVRVFKGRTATGVRGMRLASGDQVIGMSILNGQDATADERESYLKAAAWKNNEAVNNDEKALGDLSPEQKERMAEREQFILTITENGYGKRTSSYEYRTTGRGGQGIVNIVTSDRNGAVVASGPVTTSEQLMLLTNAGKIIRIGIQDIRIAGRNTQGVTLFRIDPEEKVVSVAKVPEPGEEAEDQRDEDLESPQAAQDTEIDVDSTDPMKDESQTDED